MCTLQLAAVDALLALVCSFDHAMLSNAFATVFGAGAGGDYFE